MDYPYRLKVKLFFENKKKAKTTFRAVCVELGQKHERRSDTKMDINKNVVLLKINALDLKALRASMNSYLKLFFLSESLMEVF